MFGGYQKERLESPSEFHDDYLCGICLTICKEATVLNCCHMFCEQCLLFLTKKECPTCRTHITQMVPSYRDRLKIQSFRIHCTYDCKEIMRIGDLPIHEKNCPYRIISCFHCTEEYQFFQSELHKEKCPYRLIDCLYCLNQMAFCEQEIHMLNCDYQPDQCPKCQLKDLRWKIKSHLCDLDRIPCRYQKYGCLETCDRKDMKSHEDTNHIILLQEFIDRKMNVWNDILHSQLQDGPFIVSSHPHPVYLFKTDEDDCIHCYETLEYTYGCKSCNYYICIPCFSEKRVFQML